MQWWNDLLDWIASNQGWRIFSGAVIPFVAIIVAGIVGAVIGRSGVKRLVAQRDRETRVAAVAALVTAGQNASRWHSQGPDAREHAQQVAAEADIAVRLLPVPGADLAADWARRQLASMAVSSSNFSTPTDDTLTEYQSRLVAWLRRPRRAGKLFATDLERWDVEVLSDGSTVPATPPIASYERPAVQETEAVPGASR